MRLPDGYPRLTSSGRGALEMSVLNNEWVSVTSGSEDYSFKVRLTTDVSNRSQVISADCCQFSLQVNNKGACTEAAGA